ncbi:hypothetical protein BKA62DRAFT_733415 [Auriculariales sp. MPI-PUGE-AT-0066]|nr:hypothetical protein BKA62DRAFT_733415 [Auriculariales sp. MPI-PUGE-AT-0066]
MRSARAQLVLGLVAAASYSGRVHAQTTGGKTCVGSTMCVAATANATSTLYELSYTGSGSLGWMAIQRLASNYGMPSLISNPPRVATLDATNTNSVAAQPVIAFTIPTDPDTQTRQRLIWAVSTRNPGSSDPAATIAQHGMLTMGAFTLDVSTPVSSSSSSSSGDSTSGGTAHDLPTQSTALPALTKAQKLIIAHAILFTIGFMLLLPAGALFARLLRTTTPHWFKGHWIIQFYLTAPILLIGLATAVAGVADGGAPHFDGSHEKLGLVLCVLYVVQCSFGAIIHFVKDGNRQRRPPQNYIHAILGLLIMVIAFAQVRSGYRTEWPEFSGRGSLGNGINVLWIVWAVVPSPVLYFGGLALLPKQYSMEQRDREYRDRGVKH